MIIRLPDGGHRTVLQRPGRAPALNLSRDTLVTGHIDGESFVNTSGRRYPSVSPTSCERCSAPTLLDSGLCSRCNRSHVCSACKAPLYPDELGRWCADCRAVVGQVATTREEMLLRPDNWAAHLLRLAARAAKQLPLFD